MSVVKFIIPADGSQSDGGEIVEVPQADAKHFDEKGWKRVGASAAKETEAKKPKK